MSYEPLLLFGFEWQGVSTKFMAIGFLNWRWKIGVALIKFRIPQSWNKVNM